MSGPVERAIRHAVNKGTRLATPTGRGIFVVEAIDRSHLVLALGEKQSRTPVGWTILEGLPDYLRGRGAVRIGGTFSSDAIVGTLDAYLKAHIKRATAGWVAVILEQAGVLQIDRRPPATVCLQSGW